MPERSYNKVVHVETIEIRGLEESSPGVLFGTTSILGGNFHVSCISVRDKEQSTQVVVGGQEAEERMTDLVHMDPGGPFESVELEGFPGEWVIVITPFCR